MTPLTRRFSPPSPRRRGEELSHNFLRPAKQGEEPALSDSERGEEESKGAAERRMRGDPHLDGRTE